MQLFVGDNDFIEKVFKFYLPEKKRFMLGLNKKKQKKKNSKKGDYWFHMNLKTMI